MNILQITPKVPYPPIDGSAIAIANHSLAFSACGHSVSIMAVNTPKHYSEATQIPDKNNNIFIKKVYINTNINFFKALINLLFSRTPYISKRFFSKKFNKELIRILHQIHFDIIQIEGMFMGQYIHTIKKHSKALIALRAHNIEHEIWYRNAQNEKNPFKKWYLNNLSKRVLQFEKVMLNQYDVLVPITNRDLEKFKDLGNHLPAYVAPFGIDIENCKPYKNDANQLSVFFLGALDWIPNQEGLIWFIENVWIEIQDKFKDINFYIAGRNAPEWLVKKIKSYPVNYEGEVNDAFLFMKSKGIMVVPLFAGSGMRVKIIEGMALQKAIVTTSIGVEGIALENKKQLLIANTKEEYIQQLELLLDDNNLISELGKSANAFAIKNFDNFVICKGLLKFYGDYQNKR